MNGGRFKVGLKDTICSKKFLKNKCLLKEDVDINEEIKISCPGEMEIMKLKTDIDSLGISLDTLLFLPDSREVALHIAGYIDSLGISLDTLLFLPDSREVAVHIAGYIAKRYLKKFNSSSCCKMHIMGSIDIENPHHEYLIILN